jgi:hypothetical protein
MSTIAASLFNFESEKEPKESENFIREPKEGSYKLATHL